MRTRLLLSLWFVLNAAVVGCAGMIAVIWSDDDPPDHVVGASFLGPLALSLLAIWAGALLVSDAVKARGHRHPRLRAMFAAFAAAAVVLVAAAAAVASERALTTVAVTTAGVLGSAACLAVGARARWTWLATVTPVLLLAGTIAGCVPGARFLEDQANERRERAMVLEMTQSLFEFDGGAYMLPGTPLASYPLGRALEGETAGTVVSPAPLDDPLVHSVQSQLPGTDDGCVESTTRLREPVYSPADPPAIERYTERVEKVRCLEVTPTATLRVKTVAGSRPTFILFVREPDADVRVFFRIATRHTIQEVLGRSPELADSLVRADVEKHTPQELADAIIAEE